MRLFDGLPAKMQSPPPKSVASIVGVTLALWLMNIALSAHAFSPTAAFMNPSLSFFVRSSTDISTPIVRSEVSIVASKFMVDYSSSLLWSALDGDHSIVVGNNDDDETRPTGHAGNPQKITRRKKLDTQWWENYDTLKTYREKHGHCLVPASSDKNSRNDNNNNPDYSKLHKWITAQRHCRQYSSLRCAAVAASNNNPDDSISAQEDIISAVYRERYDALVGIDFIWNVYDYKWERQFERLEQFHSAQNHSHVPSTTKLGKWAATQRRHYDCSINTNNTKTKQSVSLLTPERIHRLNALDFHWNTTVFTASSLEEDEHTWVLYFQELVLFYQQHGHTSVSSSNNNNDDRNNNTLASWIKTQRRLYRQDKLSSDRETLLDWTFNDIWDPTPTWKTRLLGGDTRWRAHLEELRAYRDDVGDCLVPQHYRGPHGNSTLGHWVDQQRRRLGGRSDADAMTTPLLRRRRDLLEDLGFDWSAAHKMHAPRDRLWYERLEDLKVYKAQHHHCMVPLRYAVHPQLGRWVSTQRQQYHRKRLQEEDEQYYRERGQRQPEGDGATSSNNSSCSVGHTNTPKKTMMTEERLRVLDELGFVWEVRQKRKRRPRREEYATNSSSSTTTTNSD